MFLIYFDVCLFLFNFNFITISLPKFQKVILRRPQGIHNFTGFFFWKYLIRHFDKKMRGGVWGWAPSSHKPHTRYNMFAWQTLCGDIRVRNLFKVSTPPPNQWKACFRNCGMLSEISIFWFPKFCWKVFPPINQLWTFLLKIGCFKYSHAHPLLTSRSLIGSGLRFWCLPRGFVWDRESFLNSPIAILMI